MNLESPATVSALIDGGRGVGLGGTGVGGTWVSVAARGEAVSVGGGEPADRPPGSEHANTTIATASTGAIFFMGSYLVSDSVRFRLSRWKTTVRPAPNGVRRTDHANTSVVPC
jgi:hypothetical protein